MIIRAIAIISAILAAPIVACSTLSSSAKMAGAPESPLPLSPATALIDVTPASKECTSVVTADVGTILLGTKPSKVWARQRAGFIAEVPLGLIGITYAGNMQHTQVLCQGAAIDIEYRLLTPVLQWTLKLPRQWNVQGLIVTNHDVDHGGKTEVFAFDRREKSLGQIISDPPTLVTAEPDLIMLRYRQNTCDPKHFSMQLNPIEFADVISDNSRGLKLSHVSIQVPWCKKPF